MESREGRQREGQGSHRRPLDGCWPSGWVLNNAGFGWTEKNGENMLGGSGMSFGNKM